MCVCVGMGPPRSDSAVWGWSVESSTWILWHFPPTEGSRSGRRWSPGREGPGERRGWTSIHPRVTLAWNAIIRLKGNRVLYLETEYD